MQSETSRSRMSDCRDSFDFNYCDLNPSAKQKDPRKRGTCNGGYSCHNPACFDILGDGDKNSTAFRITRNSKGKPLEIYCRVCSESQFVVRYSCSVVKIIRLPKDSLFAYCYTQGRHNDTCRGLRRKVDSGDVTSKLHSVLTGGLRRVCWYSSLCIMRCVYWFPYDFRLCTSHDV